MLPSVLRFCLFLALMVAPSAFAAPRQLHESGAAFVGATGCKSSSCHGGAGARRSQFATWSQHDFHARAYAVLVNARSARIAETLGVPQAQSSARCTVCHSPFQAVAPALRKTGAHPDEGVSCESCHGAAGGWLRGHTRPDWTYATRVGAGMRDLRSIYVRANACVACHQNVEPELLRAGHPELRFELDSQSLAEPKHWLDPASASGPRQWLTGQAVALREMSWALGRGEQSERERLRWDALVWLLAKTLNVDTLTPTRDGAAQPAHGEFAEMERAADDLARLAPNWNFNEAAVLNLLRRFAGAAPEFSEGTKAAAGMLEPRAERLVPAVQRLTQAIDSATRARLNIDPAIDLLAQDTQRPEQFDAPLFAAHLQNLSAFLAQPTR